MIKVIKFTVIFILLVWLHTLGQPLASSALLEFGVAESFRSHGALEAQMVGSSAGF
jgi:hypothetical protein